MNIDGLRHIAWPNRVSVAWYAIRRLVIKPAPPANRCIMGAPVHPIVHCPRSVVRGSLWCRRHQP